MARTKPDNIGRPPPPEWAKEQGTEMYLSLWLRIMGATQNPMFNIKVVR